MENTWTNQIRMRNQGEEENIPWWVNDKIKLHDFCVKNDLPIPRILARWDRPTEINLDDMPSEFVLKPSVMHSAWGVMVLRRLDDGISFYESLSKRTLTAETIMRDQVKVYDMCKYKNDYTVFVEEKIQDAVEELVVPLDYKIYCFYDKPMLVQQFDRNPSPKTVAFFDENFERLDFDANIQSDWTAIAKGSHITPSSPIEMLEIAARATVLLKTPFMSVDMYSSSRGPMIGELTPSPGGPYYGDWYRFTESFNRSLGTAWTDAARRIVR